LDQPFVDGFSGMGHEDSAFEIGLCENIRKRSCMVEMETGTWCISNGLDERRSANSRPMEETDAQGNVPTGDSVAWLKKEGLKVIVLWYGSRLRTRFDKSFEGVSSAELRCMYSTLLFREFSPRYHYTMRSIHGARTVSKRR
jgi:hypothetical protein